jgi:chaperonin GroES
MKIKPLGERVLIEPLEAKSTTSGGIIIPENAKEKPSKGTVVAVGSTEEGKALTVKVGDTVLYGKYSGTELDIEDKAYLIMPESDILAII